MSQTTPVSKGEALAASLRKKTVFYDRHEERAYKRATLLAARLIDDPRLVNQGEKYLDLHVKCDPHQRHSYALWRALLTDAPERIAAALLDDTPLADDLRNTAPVFFVITPSDARRLWADA